MKTEKFDSSRNLLPKFRMSISILFSWLTIYADYYFGWWSQAISGLHLRENFLDLKIVLGFAECYKQDGTDVYQPVEGDIIECTGYQYGRLLLQVLNLFHINESNASLLANLGIITTLLIFTSLFFTMGYKSPLYFCAYFLMVGGGHLRLLLERGNFDILVLALVFLAMHAYRRDFRGLSFLLVSFAALIKFYAFGLLIIFLFTSRSRRELVLQILGVASVGLLIFRDLSLIQVPFVSTNYISFGAPWIGAWYDFSTDYQSFLRISVASYIWHLLGISLLFLVSYIVNRHFIKPTTSVHSKFKSVRNDLVVVFFGTVHLTCYLSGMNYDYRLFFFVLGALASLNRFDFRKKSTLHYLHVALFLTVWSSFPIGIMKQSLLNYSAQALGNMGILFFTSVVLVTLLRILSFARKEESAMRVRFSFSR